MIPLILSAILTAHLSPIGPETPDHEPQMAANGATIALAFGAGRTIYFSSSQDGGKTFSAPSKVAEAGILPLTRHRGPRIAFAGNAIVITAVTGTRPEAGGHAHGLPSDGDLFVWRSTDGGKSWSAPKAINDVPAAATEGLHALASDGKGTLMAAWLDHRGGKGTKLYASRSTDGGVTWSKNFAVYLPPGGSICECCHPSLAIDAAGRVLVMFRNSLAGSRDMYLASSEDGGATFSTPRKLGNGTWKINACPMDGGGLAAGGGKVITAWRRESDIFLDEPGQAERLLGTGKDVALALSAGHIYAAWENGPKVEAWKDGKLEVLSESGTYPSLCALPAGGALAAWEQNGAIVMRRLP